ncbi:MAG: polymerase III, delta prime subunit protein [Candidatus Moranbacteria bacterium GW2011_GWE1_49_15]|nr:MAG: polymerase III, delta prime subunit protein [Candidatus Moranbacteria bacterium GW2011_GWE2_47_10]KKW07490.1 MAG: polymerase III, delta prime subunit protein [Candidatus Moranbacteria bacterium GW2011_GWE1_49_15]
MRSMNFIGNKKAVSFIEKTLEKGGASQAYLFSGPEGVGKLFLAKAFAKSLISGGSLPDFESGDVEKLPVDLILLKPEIEEKKGIRKERDIAVERIRDAKKDLSLYPYSGKMKVLIVDNAHRMNVASQNAFLKLLEEPNSTSVIILVTHEYSKMLPTIRSRCQKVGFGLVGPEDMGTAADFLGGDFVSRYAEAAMGRPGLLFRMSTNQEELALYRDASEELAQMSSADLNRKFSFAEKMSKDVDGAIKTLNMWSWMIRKKALAENGADLDSSYGNISKIEETVSALKNTNANARLVLENLLINIR